MKREEAIKILDDVIPPPNHHTVDLDHLPIAQAWVVIKNELKMERRTGEWLMKPDSYGFFEEIPVCSECGCTTKWREKYLYCPNCGVKMEGEDNATD